MGSYRLPAALGGAIHYGQLSDDEKTVTFILHDLGELSLPLAVLTEVWPQEPVDLSFVVVDLGESFRAYRRDDRRSRIDGAVGECRWWDLVDGLWVTWRQVCDGGQPVEMFPKNRRSARGICAGCGREVPLNANGGARSHNVEGDQGTHCKGSRKAVARVVA